MRSQDKVLKISLNTKRRPWLDGIFSQIKNTSLPLIILLQNAGLNNLILANKRINFVDFFSEPYLINTQKKNSNKKKGGNFHFPLFLKNII